MISEDENVSLTVTMESDGGVTVVAGTAPIDFATAIAMLELAKTQVVATYVHDLHKRRATAKAEVDHKAFIARPY